MAFNSLEYGIFLVIVFLVYWALAKAGLFRIAFMLVASWVFYAASNPYFLTLIWASTLCDYFAGLYIADHDDPRRRKVALIISLVLNLGLLSVFKYTNFFLETGVGVANLFGADIPFTRLDILLPAGISFYTFQTMSYTIDVYRRQCDPERNFIKFAFFVGFFPQLVAGPIVRAVDFLPQIQQRPYFTRQQASRALWLIGLGIAKKVAIADVLGRDIVQRVFDDPNVLSSADVLLGLYAYTMQIYMDFSAYSDIAIGSAILFGYKLPDNFDRPYMATSIQDFWRRWHKTLGSWLRDYIYYPLGGGHGAPARVYRNLFITFLLIGLWHGADWTFVVYGGLHATAMCVNRWRRKRAERLGRVKETFTAWGTSWRVFLTLHFVVLARILFRAGSYAGDPDVRPFDKAGDVFAALFRGTYTDVTLTPWLIALLVGAYLWHWTPRAWTEATFHGFKRLPFLAQGAIVALVLLAVSLLSQGRPPPFMYMKFLVSAMIAACAGRSRRAPPFESGGAR